MLCRRARPNKRPLYTCLQTDGSARNNLHDDVRVLVDANSSGVESALPTVTISHRDSKSSLDDCYAQPVRRVSTTAGTTASLERRASAVSGDRLRREAESLFLRPVVPADDGHLFFHLPPTSMNATEPQLRCCWRECPSAGPYANAKSLFEHLAHAHTPGIGRPLLCRWVGCKCKSSTRGTQEQSRHIRMHAGYRPYGCARPACAASFCSDYELKRHVRRCTALDVPALALGLRCRWAGCPRAFAKDAGGAALLAAHLAAEHCAAPCQWAGCVRRPRGPRASFKIHILAHLPEWYRPFACSECGETYNQRSALTRHQNAAIWRSGCPKRRGELAVGASKRRKLDEHAADMLPPSSPPSIGSSPLTSPTFSPPPPPASSSPPSSVLPLSSSPPPVEQAGATLEITNAALHSRLLSAEKLISEMQVEMDELRRTVQSRLECTPPSERDDDFDWSLDD